MYVAGLAAFLKSKRNLVTIIAAVPEKAFTEREIFYEDAELQAIKYCVEGITVVGVKLVQLKTADIYQKYNAARSSSFQLMLGSLSTEKWDIFHLHSNTAAIGESLLYAVHHHSPVVSVTASYHLPLSCVKGTLMLSNGFKECSVKAETNICTACVLSGKLNLPSGFTKIVAALLPKFASQKFPTSLRIKFLVNEFIMSFHSLGNKVDQWHVFSSQIAAILKINGVTSEKIMCSRHGVKEFFFEATEPVRNRKIEPVIFIYTGRFEKAKGFITLLKAWQQIPESKTRRLIIIGEMQNKDEEVSKIISAAVMRNDIEWTGFKKQQEVALLMQRAHCAIVPSECLETGPLVFSEAIAAGCNVIASDIGGCKELAGLHKSTAVVFEAGNISSLRKSILEFHYSGPGRVPGTEEMHYAELLDSYYQSLKQSA